MIFLTVGTQFSFDRLVKAVDELVSRNGFEEKIFAQIGDTSYRPHNFEYVQFLDKEAFDNCIRKASGMISHAGIGTITMALDNVKPLLVMPRLKRYGEVVNDHQLAIAREFEKLGHILVAYQEENLPSKIERLKSFVPQQRKINAKAVAERIGKFLESLRKNNK